MRANKWWIASRLKLFSHTTNSPQPRGFYQESGSVSQTSVRCEARQDKEEPRDCALRFLFQSPLFCLLPRQKS